MLLSKLPFFKSRAQKVTADVCLDVAGEAAGRGWHFEALGEPKPQRRNASRTTPECVQEFGHNAIEWIRINDNTRAHKSSAAAEQYYRELYATFDDLGPDLYTCDIPQAKIETEMGCVATGGGTLVQGSTMVNALLCAGRLQQVKSPVHLAGSYVSLLAPWPTNHAHWIMDCLPKLMALEGNTADKKFLIHPKTLPYQKEGYRLLGLEDSQLVEAPPVAFSVDEVTIVHAAIHTGRPSAELMRRLRERMWEAFGVTQPQRKLRLFISRSESSRPFANEPEIKARLLDHGFQPVLAEHLSLAEQAQLFSQADCVFGSHGAGTLNIIFAPPGAKIVEVYNPRKWDSACSRISSYLGLNHWHLYGKNLDEQFTTSLDPERLTNFLKILDQEPA